MYIFLLRFSPEIVTDVPMIGTPTIPWTHGVVVVVFLYWQLILLRVIAVVTKYLMHIPALAYIYTSSKTEVFKKSLRPINCSECQI